MGISRWLVGSRPRFLAVAVVMVLHGSALAFWQGSFHPLRFVLALVGLVLLHGSANILNDWHDYTKTGIDRVIRRTPFSGGSGQLAAGNLSTTEALAAGIAWLLLGSAVGFWLVLDLSHQSPGAGWPLLAMGLMGVAIITAYTPVAVRMGLGELLAAVGLGLLSVIGVYYLHTLRLDATAWWSSVPSLLLTYNLLYLNEFPDRVADQVGRRRNLVILLGPSVAIRWYVVVEAAAFVAITVGVTVGALTPWALLGLIGLVPAIRAVRGALANHDRFEELLPALRANVAAVLVTNAALSIGYVVAGVLGAR